MGFDKGSFLGASGSAWVQIEPSATKVDGRLEVVHMYSKRNSPNLVLPVSLCQSLKYKSLSPPSHIERLASTVHTSGHTHRM